MNHLQLNILIVKKKNKFLAINHNISFKKPTIEIKGINQNKTLVFFQTQKLLIIDMYLKISN